jgi:hypothetical protein
MERDITLPVINGLECGCTELQACERHTLMKEELARRYGAKVTAFPFSGPRPAVPTPQPA